MDGNLSGGGTLMGRGMPDPDYWSDI